MAFRQCADPSVRFRVIPCHDRSVHQQDFCCTGQSGIQFLVCFMKIKRWFAGCQSGPILVVSQMAHDIQAHTARIGQILPLTEGKLRSADRGITIPESHKVNTCIVCRAFPQRSCGFSCIARCTVLPLCYTDLCCRFCADVIQIVDGKFRIDFPNRFYQTFPVLLCTGRLKRRILFIIRIARIILLRNFQPILFPEQPFAVFAVTGAMINTAVIHHQKAAHVAEHAIKRMRCQNFPKDL